VLPASLRPQLELWLGLAWLGSRVSQCSHQVESTSRRDPLLTSKKAETTSMPSNDASWTGHCTTPAAEDSSQSNLAQQWHWYQLLQHTEDLRPVAAHLAVHHRYTADLLLSNIPFLITANFTVTRS